MVVVVPITAATTATAAPLPSPPLSPLLQPLPASPHLQPHQWLVVLSSAALHFLHHPPYKFFSPCRPAIIDAFIAGLPSPFADHQQLLSCCSCPKHLSPLPLPLMISCCVLRPPSSLPTAYQAENISSFYTLGLILLEGNLLKTGNTYCG